MKAFTFFSLCFQLLFMRFVQAQEVIQGDTLYRSLRVHQSSAQDIIRTLGKPGSTTEMLAPFHVLLTGGGDGHGMRLYGYAFNYRKPRVQFVLDEEKKRLEEIRFGPKAQVVTAKGIQTVKNTFGDVLERYGKLNPDKPGQEGPRIQGWFVSWKGHVHYTLLRYAGITFVSYGKWVRGEDITPRRVDEIWLF